MPHLLNVERGITWKSRLSDFYFWCKAIAVALNIIYMTHTFEMIYEAGSSIAHQEKQYSAPFQAGFNILISCLMLFCLIVDLVVLTTTRLSIADWYWRPGLFFLIFIVGNQMIGMTDLLLNSDDVFLNCTKKYVDNPLLLTNDFCTMQIQLKQVINIIILCRELISCGAYFITGYIYITHFIKSLKSRSDSRTINNTMNQVLIDTHRPPASY
ncbi:hypothetical protein BDB01DRAFT_903240 [Pilobolus umbonatus]|nr:hypothetical protein BDB01DRAFT_903240 [Pilobolus umbonatus]